MYVRKVYLHMEAQKSHLCMHVINVCCVCMHPQDIESSGRRCNAIDRDDMTSSSCTLPLEDPASELVDTSDVSHVHTFIILFVMFLVLSTKAKLSILMFL